MLFFRMWLVRLSSLVSLVRLGLRLLWSGRGLSIVFGGVICLCSLCLCWCLFLWCVSSWCRCSIFCLG